MAFINKIIAGGTGRASRLHTERGEMIDLRELRHLPRVTIDKFSAVISGKRGDVPWWPMSVIPCIDSLINKSSDVIEFGSGSSTVWLAKRARTVIAIEDDAAWKKTVTDRLNAIGLDNAIVRFAPDKEYFNLTDFSTHRFDLAVIDGAYRWECIKSVIPLMRPGGSIYLDNSDADKDKRYYPDTGMKFVAQELLESYAMRDTGSILRRFSSLISGELHAGEGMLLTLS